jgi:hypothetical protein
VGRGDLFLEEKKGDDERTLKRRGPGKRSGMQSGGC